MKIFQSFGILILFAVFAQACGSSEYPDFDKTKSGLYYKFHQKTDGVNAEIGEYITFDLVYKDEEGKTLMDTREMGHPSLLMLIESEYPGDIYEGLSMMSVGDSASFVLDADDFFQITAKIEEEYDFIEPESKLFVDIKMINIQNEQEFEEEQIEMMRQKEEDGDRAFQEEQRLLQEYLDKQNIKETPRSSGLIYIEMKKGDGPKVKQGQEVKVHYTGMLLDGSVFEDSKDSGEPISVVIGRQQVISGWDEGIQLMNVGGKARLIIPSYLAYGDRGAGNVIPPFTTLIFDVEVVDAN